RGVLPGAQRRDEVLHRPPGHRRALETERLPPALVSLDGCHLHEQRVNRRPGLPRARAERDAERERLNPGDGVGVHPLTVAGPGGTGQPLSPAVLAACARRRRRPGFPWRLTLTWRDAA